MELLWKYGILGVVQGITEWLPISSDGHLVLFHEWLRLPEDLALDVFLHLGSLLVILFYFRREIIDLIKGVFQPTGRDSRIYAGQVIATTGVTVIVALLLDPYIAGWQTVQAVAWFFLITGLFVGSTKFFIGSKGSLTWPKVLVLGLVQGLAVLPGVSRSGLMLGTALMLGIEKKTAFRYTFLAAIPAIAGAFVFKLKDMQLEPAHFFGFLVTIVVGYFALRLLDFIVDKNKFYLFSLYTFALAILLFIFLR